MAHQYSRVGFNSAVEVKEVNLSLSYGGVNNNYQRNMPEVGMKYNSCKMAADLPESI